MANNNDGPDPDPILEMLIALGTVAAGVVLAILIIAIIGALT